MPGLEGSTGAAPEFNYWIPARPGLPQSACRVLLASPQPRGPRNSECKALIFQDPLSLGSV